MPSRKSIRGVSPHPFSASNFYSSSSSTSSTLGDRFLLEGVEVAIAGAPEVVVADAGAGWPVMAAMVEPALAEPEGFDFFLPFFFSYC